MGGKVADTFIWVTTIKFGDLAILFFGVATSLFIGASQLFLHAREHDVFGFSKEYDDRMKAHCEKEGENWESIKEDQTETCMTSETLGRRFYNLAIFAMFVGLGFAVAPCNALIAFLAAGLGIALEAWQALRHR